MSKSSKSGGNSTPATVTPGKNTDWQDCSQPLGTDWQAPARGGWFGGGKK